MQDIEEGMRPWDSSHVGAATMAPPPLMLDAEDPPPPIMVMGDHVPDTVPGMGKERDGQRGAWSFLFSRG